MFRTIYPIRKRIIHCLGASSLSAFCYAFDLELSSSERHVHLDLIMDIPELSDWIGEKILEGCQVALVGADVDRLRYRINEPNKFKSWHKEMYTIWLLVLCPIEDSKSTARLGHRLRVAWKDEKPSAASKGSINGNWWRYRSVNENGINIVFASPDDPEIMSAIQFMMPLATSPSQSYNEMFVPRLMTMDSSRNTTVRVIPFRPDKGTTERL